VIVCRIILQNQPRIATSLFNYYGYYTTANGDRRRSDAGSVLVVSIEALRRVESGLIGWSDAVCIQDQATQVPCVGRRSLASVARPEQLLRVMSVIVCVRVTARTNVAWNWNATQADTWIISSH